MRESILRAGTGIALLAMILPGAPGGTAWAFDQSDYFETPPSNEAYEDAIWGRGIDDEVRYLRPDATFSTEGLQAREAPPDPEGSNEMTDQERFLWGLLLAAILAAVIYVFVRNAGGIGVSFQRLDKEGRPEVSAEALDRRHLPLGDESWDALIQRLSAMADKREALILLARWVMERAAREHGVRPSPADTMRELLRRLRPDQGALRDMRSLVMAAELAHFGGRDVPESMWDECLSNARRITSHGNRS